MHFLNLMNNKDRYYYYYYYYYYYLQLLDEADYHLKNYGDRGGCYLAEVDSTL